MPRGTATLRARTSSTCAALAPLAVARETKPTVARGKKTTKYLRRKSSCPVHQAARCNRTPLSQGLKLQGFPDRKGDPQKHCRYYLMAKLPAPCLGRKLRIGPAREIPRAGMAKRSNSLAQSELFGSLWCLNDCQ